MNGKNSWQQGALAVAAALIVGCAPDAPGTNASQSRPGESAVSRNEPSQAPTIGDRDLSGGPARPPSAAESATPPAATLPPAATPRLMARADVRPLSDNTTRGAVEFQAAAGDGAGPVTVHVMLMGLDAGPHGMHVHEGTDCAAPGEHLNPLHSPHGAANAGADARHLGDLGNITADASGMVEAMLRDTLLGQDSSFIGKVIVVHKGQDDLSTQPGGDSGDPVACGVIEAVSENVLSQGEAPNRVL